MSHVFVIEGDITHLACDAWMLSTSRRLGLSGWTTSVPDLLERADASDTSRLQRGDESTAVLAGGPPNDPVVVLTAVPSGGHRGSPPVSPAVRSFFHTATAAIRGRPVRRSRPLIAMPFFTTGQGGGADRKGRVLNELLDVMSSCAEEFGVDAVLVLRDHDAYGLAQLARARDRRFLNSLTKSERDQVRALVGDARSGRLVPFVGAGVSVSAGAPTWADLIGRLADRILQDPRAAESLKDSKRDTLDQAAALRAAWDELKSRERDSAHREAPQIDRERRDREDARLGFNQIVVEALGDLDRYGLVPALLAALPAKEAITLNYDSLFELAAADADSPRRVIPRPDAQVDQPTDRLNERWLLKLHGSVDAPGSIVLTRDDYLGYEQDRGALSSLVKAMLMTRHLLFVGFGLADDHFHEILYDVRRAVSGQGASALDTTVLKLQADPLDDLLWKDDLRLVPFTEPHGDIAKASRRLEIFLDALLCFSSDDHSYLLKESFDHALTDSDRRLKRALDRLQRDADPEVRSSAAWKVVDEALGRLGATD